LDLETTPGAAQVLSYLEEPVQREKLDLVMGIDEILFERARPHLLQVELVEAAAKERFEPLIRSRIRSGFLPVDYGALTFIYRKSGKKPLARPPKRLQDLLSPGLRKRWIVQDPRASSPGLLFFLFTDSILKVGDMGKAWLLLAPGWETSYKMFLAGESDMVWSYLSSLAYHASKGEGDLYSAAEFEEGLPVQVEGLSVVNRPGNPLQSNPCIRKWIDFILDPAIQARLVEKQWMMPVIRGTALPPAFRGLPPVKKAASLPGDLETVDRIISRFGKELARDGAR
jgi:thiamine transport system substrate-binding protein